MTFARWEIWEVPWVNADGTTKYRPALLVSVRPETSDPLTFLCISTKGGRQEPAVKILSTDSEFHGTGLNSDSFVYVTQAQSFLKDQVVMRRGVAAPATRLAVETELAKWLKRRREAT